MLRTRPRTHTRTSALFVPFRARQHQPTNGHRSRRRRQPNEVLDDIDEMRAALDTPLDDPDEEPTQDFEDDDAYAPPLEETGYYFRVGNGLIDWNLPMPAAFKLVWLALLRFANNRKVPRLVTKISHARLANACFLNVRVVSQAIRFLAAIQAIHIMSPAHTRRDGTRLTAAYQVHPVSALSRDRLRTAISAVCRERPDLLLLRPDQARIDRARARA